MQWMPPALVREETLYGSGQLPKFENQQFKIRDDDKGAFLEQTATFRPRGIFGRMYWYAVFPFHLFIFQGMAERIVKN